MRTYAALSALALFCAVSGPATARADEGMWPFNMVPKDRIQKEHGVALTDAWLDHVRLASVRFDSGGSGSFVSENGLVLTNHHVASDCISKLARQGKDYFADGYLAGRDGPEARCPDLELNQLISIEDVTARVAAARQPNMSDADANVAIKAAMSQIEKACADSTGLRCDVVTLYAGGMYNLYSYKKYTDVRLVFAPEGAIAFFGGDADNFTFPRFDYDLAIFRVYEKDAPAKPKDYLRWNPAGPKDGDTVFVSGHPGKTERMDTLAQLTRLRDVTYPYGLDQANRERALLTEFARANAEQAREAARPRFGIDNSRKAATGFMSGFKDPELMKKKAASEAQLRAAIAADPALSAKYGTVFDEIERAQKTLGEVYARYASIERGPTRSPLFHIARDLVRMPRELALPNGKRLREYRDSNLESARLSLFSSAPIYGGVEAQLWQAWFERLVKNLGPQDPAVVRLLAGRTPARAAQEIVALSKLTDVYERRALEAGGQAAVDASKDAAIVAIVTLEEEARAVRKRYEDEVEAPMRQYGERVAQAVFAVKGTAVYPDATFTLRLSTGVVKGYVEGGKAVPWSTDFAGMYQHATGTEPRKLPQRWLDKKSALAPSTPYNFVSTDDIIGGNSGSPVVDAKGDLVGLIFDGNLTSLPNVLVYRDTTQRAVSVDTAGILEGLRSVYGAQDLLRELVPGPAAPPARVGDGPRPQGGATM
jgi:S1-C subfamily serine protease